MHEPCVDPDYIAGLFRTQEHGIRDMLNNHWNQIEARDANYLKAAGLLLMAILTMCFILLWHHDRIVRLEHKISVIQQKVGIDPEGTAGVW